MMVGLAAQAALASAPPAASFRAAPGQRPVNPHANELFDRDAELKAWALKLHDGNRDGWLTLYEAQPALRMFKDIADADRDGRVTTYEYSRAKEFIAARW